MGNANTNIKKNVNNEYSNDLLFRTVNKISSDLILNTNNEDLLQFMNPEYCDKIINLTSNILYDNFTKNQLNIINNKIIKKNNKKPVDEFIQNLKDIDDSIYDSEIYKKKNDICEEIAIYYVKIVHIFSAIKIVIDTDDSICNKTKKFKYDKINKGKNAFDTTISADICSKDKSSKDKSSKDIKTEETLKNENGIPELENLFKDKYIPEREEFVMSEKQKKEYEKALSKFYKSYTGSMEGRDKYKRFSDIPVLKYKSVELCKKMKDKSKSRLIGNSKNDNIVNFANHLATIMNNSRMFDKKLIEILNYLFIPNENGKDYVINENISFDDIDEIIENVRENIMDLYITCDEDYRKGIKLFEKILLDKNIELAEKRLKPNKNFDKNVNINNYYKKKEEEDKEKKIDEDEDKEKAEEDDIKKLTAEEKDLEQYMAKQEKKWKENNKELLDKEQREQDEIDNEDKNLKKIMKDIDEAADAAFTKYDLNDIAAREALERGAKERLMFQLFQAEKCPFGHKLKKIPVEEKDNEGFCDICDDEINIGDHSITCVECRTNGVKFDICEDLHSAESLGKRYIQFSEHIEKDENNKKKHMSKENNSLIKFNQLNELIK